MIIKIEVFKNSFFIVVRVLIFNFQDRINVNIIFYKNFINLCCINCNNVVDNFNKGRGGERGRDKEMLFLVKCYRQFKDFLVLLYSDLIGLRNLNLFVVQLDEKLYVILQF